MKICVGGDLFSRGIKDQRDQHIAILGSEIEKFKIECFVIFNIIDGDIINFNERLHSDSNHDGYFNGLTEDIISGW